MTAPRWHAGVLMLFACAPITGTGPLTDARFPGEPPVPRLQRPVVPGAGAIAPPKPARSEQRRTDLYGDALPPGILLRLGTVRLRHRDLIRSLAVTPDRKMIASVGGGWNGAPHPIRLWDATTGKEVRQLLGHSALPCAITFSPDGKRLASVAGAEGLMRDGTVRLWDVVTGKQLCVFRGHQPLPSLGNGGFAVAFAPDGRTVASSGQDGFVRLWEPATGEECRRWRLRGSSLAHCLAFSPDGKTLAALSGANVYFWDARTGRDLPPIEFEFRAGVSWLQFTPDGKAIVSGDSDNVVRWMDLATGKAFRQVRGVRVAASSDGRKVALRRENDIQLWDVAEGKELRRFPCRGFIGYCRYPFPFCFTSGGLSADGRVLIAADGSTIRILETRSGKDLHPFQGHTAKVVFVGFSSDGSELTSAADSTVRHWDTRTGKELRRISGLPQPIATAAMAPAAKTLLVGTFNERVAHLWDIARGKELGRLETYWSNILFPLVTLSPDGRTFRTRLGDGMPAIFFWDVATGREVRHYVPGRVHFGVVSSDVVEAVTDRIASQPHVDRVSGTRMRDFEALRNVCYGDMGLAYSPDDRIAATGYPDPAPRRTNEHRTVALWEGASGRVIARCRGHQGPVGALAFSPDGRVLASGSWEGSIRLWDVASGGELAVLQGHRGGVTSLAFSPNGKSLAAGGSDTTALLFDVAPLLRGRGRPGVRIAAGDLGKLWTQLQAADPSVAYPALWKLVGDPSQTVPFLKRALHLPVPEERLIRQLIANLDDKRFEVRERATRELNGFGLRAEPVLRRALECPPPEEVRRRLERVLANLRPPAGQLPARYLRQLRAVQVLEYIGTPEARQLLQVVAQQEPASQLGQEAKAALVRLGR